MGWVIVIVMLMSELPAYRESLLFDCGCWARQSAGFGWWCGSSLSYTPLRSSPLQN